MSEDLSQPNPHQLLEHEQAEQDQHGQVAVAEDNRTEQPRTEFVDSRGEIRRSNELAAEVIVTPEIEQVVDRHFGHVYEVLPKVDTVLDKLDARLSDTEAFRQHIFNPLGADFVQKVVARAVEQQGQVIRHRPVTRTITTEEKGFLGRKKTSTQQVEDIEISLVTGKTKTLSEHDRKSLHAQSHGVDKDRHQKGKVVQTSDQRTEEFASNITTIAEDLLCGDTDERGGRYLPLLAHRLAASDKSPDQLDAQALAELVPELQPLLSTVEKARDTLQEAKNVEAANKMISALNKLMPDRELISTVYYSEADLAAIGARYQRVRSFSVLALPDRPSQASLEEFTQRGRDTIGNFFVGKLQADTLVFHGTPSIPRIIQSGALKTPVKMLQDGTEFTYYTRANDAHDSHRKLEGRRAIHFAGQHGTAYTREAPVILQEYDLPPDVLEREKNKGAMAAGAIGLRVGDALKQAPFIGTRTDSSDWFRQQHAHITSVRSGVIELTDAGYAKIAAQTATMERSDDIVFLKAPRQVEDPSLYDYEFPVDDFMFEAVETQLDAIVPELERAGWSEEKIKERLVVIERREGKRPDNDLMPDERIAGDAALLAKALAHPKYRNSVIAGLEKVAV